jgi:ketosteroid isomerase-like protein
MKMKKTLFCGSLALMLLAAACTQPAPPDTRAADEATIKELDTQWSKVATAGDVDGAVSYYSDDASVLPPNAPIANTKPAIRAAWAALLTPDVTVSWQITKVEVARSGDLGYAMGTYVVALKNVAGNPVVERGKLVEVWKKQADGKWKVTADIFNSDAPAPAPAPAEKKK